MSSRFCCAGALALLAVLFASAGDARPNRRLSSVPIVPPSHHVAFMGTLHDGDLALRADLIGQTPDGVRSPNGAVDFWIDRLLGRSMAETDRGEIVRAMAQADSPDAPLGDETFAKRLSEMVELIIMSPDFQWR